jgi:hypothetical protein
LPLRRTTGADPKTTFAVWATGSLRLAAISGRLHCWMNLWTGHCGMDRAMARPKPEIWLPGM